MFFPPLSIKGVASPLSIFTNACFTVPFVPFVVVTWLFPKWERYYPTPPSLPPQNSVPAEAFFPPPEDFRPYHRLGFLRQDAWCGGIPPLLVPSVWEVRRFVLILLLPSSTYSPNRERDLPPFIKFSYETRVSPLPPFFFVTPLGSFVNVFLAAPSW